VCKVYVHADQRRIEFTLFHGLYVALYLQWYNR